uniref:Uncharacterized protein n=1 Tax=Arundo donax TaxID=35708 RepID=A0A0A9E6L9_ARUDO
MMQLQNEPHLIMSGDTDTQCKNGGRVDQLLSFPELIYFELMPQRTLAA